MVPLKFSNTPAEPTLLEQYRSVDVPLVLEYQQAFTALAVIAGILAVILCGSSLVYYVVQKLHGDQMSKMVYFAAALGLACFALSLWSMQHLGSSDSITKYEERINALFSDRAMEKYGVQFDGMITDKNVNEASAALRGGTPATVDLGFTKDGDLILLHDGLELPAK